MSLNIEVHDKAFHQIVPDSSAIYRRTALYATAGSARVRR